LETCAAAMGQGPRWFQLYWSSDDDYVRSVIGRAEKAGCEALVLTLDTTLLGWRPRDLDIAYLPFLRGLGLGQYLSDPVFRAKIPASLPDTGIRPRGLSLVSTAMSLMRKGREFGMSMGEMRAAVAHFTATYSRPDLNWSDVERLRGMTRLPIVLKGIRHAEDARLASLHGADAIIVSNHGGRQVDGEPGALDLLEGAVAAAGDMPVLLDSGVRSGADVAKALALGARRTARPALRLRPRNRRRGGRARGNPQRGRRVRPHAGAVWSDTGRRPRSFLPRRIGRFRRPAKPVTSTAAACPPPRPGEYRGEEPFYFRQPAGTRRAGTRRVVLDCR